jgi:hypothetical protein
MEWPLMHFQYLRTRKTFGVDKPPSDVLKTWYCASSELQGDKLVTVIASEKDNIAHLEARLTFEEDLIVRCEWFVAGEGNRILLSDVSTQWDKGLPDPLPKRVHAKMDSRSQETRSMDYVVDFEWFFPGSPEFDEMKAKLQELRARLGPEREIAGAEDPKAAPKPAK